jgi:signal peptidase II
MIAIIISVVLMVVAVALDQVSKYLVVANMELHESVDLIPGVLRFTYIHNDGAAFGSMDEHRWIFMVLSTVAIVGILVFLFWKKPSDKLLLSSLVLITGGGIGNMIDRIALGYVIDFIDFCAFPKIWYFTFNVADSFVCIGAGLMFVYLLRDIVREIKAEKAAKAAAEQATPCEESAAPEAVEVCEESAQNKDAE